MTRFVLNIPVRGTATCKPSAPLIPALLSEAVPQRISLFSHTTTNLGDTIQTVAVRNECNECNEVNYYVDRDVMNRNDGQPPSFLIANGWFMHPRGENGQYAFPPPPNIEPFYVSVHIAAPGMLTPEAMLHFQRWQPVGCRDHYTFMLLAGRGIRCFLSGCVTMTLRRESYGTGQRSGLVFVDVPPPILAGLPDELKSRGEFLTHACWSYALQPERERTVHGLLRRYATANLVVTGRLHCALACSALSTPVVLLARRDDPRMSAAALAGLEIYDAMPDLDHIQPPPPTSRAHILRRLLREAIITRANPLRHGKKFPGDFE